MTPIIMISFYCPADVKRLIRELLRELPEVPVVVFDNNEDYPIIKEERNWLQSFANVRNIKIGVDLPHGMAIDFARKWLINEGYNTMVHVEPDCVITGRKWYDDLIQPLNEEYWATFSIRMRDGRYHPTPSAWRLQETDIFSWNLCHKENDKNDPLYHSLVNDKWCDCSWLLNHWDTAQYAWYKCALAGKAAYIQLSDFRHLWGGSYRSSMFLVSLL